MKKYISTSPLVAFFGMAFLLSWIAVMPKILYPALPVEPFLILGAFAGPFLSAVIIIMLTEGRSGLARFGGRYVQWRVGLAWWLLVLFGTLFALNLVAALLFGFSIWIAFFGNLKVIFPAFAEALIFGAFLGPLWEESGWRGFALPRLQTQYGPLVGSVILGIVWAVWHIPGYLGGWMKVAFLALLISCIGFSIIATWISNNIGGSILLLILLHASSNAAVSVGSFVLPESLSGAMQHFVFAGWIPAITNGVLALLILVFTRGNLSYRGEQQGNVLFSEEVAESL